MHGTVNGIYFQKNGTIPEEVIQNMSKAAVDANKTDFLCCFWTNAAILSSEVRDRLVEGGVVIRDYKEVDEPLRNRITEFIAKGDNGDIAAYALASDLLRVAIAGLAPAHQITIYSDPNDITFESLGTDLANLPESFSQNPWGFSFPIELVDFYDEQPVALLRNDRMIVRKDNNPKFFAEFFVRYIMVVEKEILNYKETNDDSSKKQQLDRISSFVTSIPFNVTKSGSVFMANNVGSLAKISSIDFASYIKSDRNIKHGNQWRESDCDATDEAEILSAGSDRADPRFFLNNGRIETTKRITLNSPLDINVEEIAKYFPEYFYRAPYTSADTVNNSALIRTQGGLGKTTCIFRFDGKTDQGFTEIHTDLSIAELSEHLGRLPESLSTVLTEALKNAGLDLPSHSAMI